MFFNKKVLVFLLGIIVIVSSLITIFYFGIEKNQTSLNENGWKSQDYSNNQNNSEDLTSKKNKDDVLSSQRYVFVEEGSFTTCKFCVPVADILHELYESQETSFYYISHVRENPNAQEILNDYNIYAYPTVYIDGGYKVVYGSKEKATYNNRIKDAYNRENPDIFVNVTGSWDETNSEIIISGNIKNMESDEYNGIFKIYMAEKISTIYRDYEGNPFHFAFINFALDREIKIPENNTYNFSKKISDKNLDPENLMIFAVVFNSSYEKRYSDPEGDGGKNEKSFDAYFVDSMDATEVIKEGNTPPAVGITYPKKGKIHFLGKERFNLQFRNTFLIGKTTIKVDAQDDGSISKVEFYIDSQKVETDEEAPYEYTIRKIGLFRNLVRRHTIKIIAYDDTDKKSEDTIDVIALLL